MQRSDRDIIDALQAGEPWALDAFYRQHAKQVLGWAIRMGGPYLDAEDVAQDVFAIALRKIGSFRGDSAVSTWLYAITRNVISNARRKATLRRWVGLDTLPELPTPDEAPEAEVANLRRRRKVQLALERLAHKPREVLVLMDLEGRTAPEVSEILGVPTGTVYSRLHYARKAFKDALQKEGVGKAEALGVVSTAGRLA